MKYTIENLENDISDIITELSTIRADRGKRYGTEEDTLANVRQAGGWRAAYINAFECIMRLRRMFFVPDKDINEKDFINAVSDLINYALYIRILKEADGREDE